MVKVKICGITNKKDALEAVRLGADMLGFVFYAQSKRFVSTQLAADIANELPPPVMTVGVFVDERESQVRRIAEDVGLKTLQFHGDETPQYCARFKDGFKVIKAFRVRDKTSLKVVSNYNVDMYMFDTYEPASAGGTGKSFDLGILKDFEVLRPFMLSGGLTPENVCSKVREVPPYGVDVSTGVERSPGVKDHELMKRFIENVRKCG